MLQYFMQEKNKIENLPFKNLPNNDNYYLVLNYGPAVKLKNESLIPNIQVILRKVNIINLTVEKDSHDTVVYIPIPELDEIRIGSVWKRRQKVLDRWKNFDTLEYMEDINFNFDFTIHNPRIVKFNEEIDSLGDSLSNIYKIKFEKSEEKNIPFFNKTNYTKLISDDGITVLIPSIELFVSAYTPQHKIIKQRLLQFNLDDAINEFINLNNSKVENQEYYIGLYKKWEDSNIKFLAYAKFNNISRNRISYLSSSLEFNSGDTISGYQLRYPIVLPYHPIHLFISSDGLWLNEKTFLIQRIYIISIPSDITVKAIIDGIIHKVEKKFYKPEKKESKPKIIESEEENQDYENGITNLLEVANITGMDSNKQPRRMESLHRVQTQVKTMDDNKPKIEILNKKEEKIELIEDSEAEDNKQIDLQNDQKTPKINKENIDGSDAEKLPSGDNSKQIKYLTSHHDIETNILLNQIIEILNNFKIEQFILDYKFLDKNFKELNELKETTFYETLLNNGFNKKDLEDNWYKLKKRENGELKELGYREYFLIEIKLIDKYCYLLEIGKKESESNYLGVIFRDSTFNKLSNEKLIKILKKVVKNEGNYSKKDSSITNVKKLKAVDLGVKYEKYSHKFNQELNEFVNLKVNIESKMKLLI
ncbi:hypothetical protein [Aliarcobacter butzleri]|uniref:hypothetical protein n=1 Tax=Aliarcobacter butzleri TaxID=28197 RepID=UPI001587979C|nr:hypothetical protein [Aliarcobacter butzleri]